MKRTAWFALEVVVITIAFVECDEIVAQEVVQSTLVKQAGQRFGKLSSSEIELFTKTPEGKAIDRSSKSELQNDPSNAVDWGEDRVVRADCLTWLCTDPTALTFVRHRGISLKGARIDGDLNLRYANAPFPLLFEKCAFTKAIDFRNAKIAHLTLDGCRTHGILADGLQVQGKLSLEKEFRSFGEIDLSNAKIGGDLSLSGSKLSNAENTVLRADMMRVDGTVEMNGAWADGEVRLAGATIGGQLQLKNCRFFNEGQRALNANSVSVKYDMYMHEGFEADGQIYLPNAVIGASLHCTDARIRNPDGIALLADRIAVGGNVLLDGDFTAVGMVRFPGAKLGRGLDCEKGSFYNSHEIALRCDQMTIGTDCSLNHGFWANGQVRLTGTTIGKNFDCSNGRFRAQAGAVALSADGLKVGGTVQLSHGFEADGGVSLPNATIGGDLDCSGGHFFKSVKSTSNANQFVAQFVALRAERTRIDGNVFLNPLPQENARPLLFKAEGEVNFAGATVSGSFYGDGGLFQGQPNSITADGLIVKQNLILHNQFVSAGAISLVGASVGRFLAWEEPAPQINRVMSINLQFAKVGILWDLTKRVTRGQPPPPKNLVLDGLIYDELYEGIPGNYNEMTPADATNREQWLLRQIEFHPQPYQQLADAFRKDGRDEEMRQILIAKERESRSMLWWPGRLWSLLLRLTIGYGYRPWRAVGLGFFIVLAGWALFEFGYRKSLIIPEGQPAYEPKDAWKRTENADRVCQRYPKFSSLVYSIDVFTPVLDLFQRKYWVPDANGGKMIHLGPFHVRIGALLRWYFWFQTVAGWTLTTLIIVGLTGLVHN
jgi:hypothetical protein